MSHRSTLIVAIAGLFLACLAPRTSQAANFTANSGDVSNVGVGTIGGLVYCVNQANITGGANTITLAASTYALIAVDNVGAGPTGLPAITSNITIVGNGAAILRSAAAPAFRLFYVTSTGSLTLQNTTLSGGLALGGDGGSGRTGGGGAAGIGGSIYNEGTVNIVSSTLTNNKAQGGNGGATVGGIFGNGGGGGLGGNGVAGSGNSDVTSTGSAGGAPNPGAAGTSSLDGGPGGFGGGGGGSATTTTSSPNGGAGGFGGGGGGGGGILGFSGGAGGFGGGGAAGFDPANIRNFGGFAGGNGGAQVGGGGAGLGGAIFNNGGTVTVTNSTVANNSAILGTSSSNNGQGLGGGIFSRNGSVTLLNTTISSNFAAQGGRGVFLVSDGIGSTANAVINNTILGQTDNTITDFDTGMVNGGTAPTSSGANNLIRNTKAFGGTSSAADPLIFGLSNNGGLTLTILPNHGSPAIDAGSNAAAAVLVTDQRGQPRNFNGTVDIGAVESEYVLEANAGDGQSAFVGSQYFTNLQLKAIELGSGFVFSGIPVSIAVPGTGASGTFFAPASGFTDKFGLYTATALTANTIAGAFKATGSATGFVSVDFNLTNLPGAPASLVIVTGNNQNAPANTAVPIQPTVQVKDSFGNPIPNAMLKFTVSSGGGSVTGGTQLSDANGIAAVGSWTLGPIAGTNTLLASIGILVQQPRQAPPSLSVTFTATGVNLPPVIDSVGYIPAYPAVGAPVTVTVVAHDPEGQPLTITYDFGDGNVVTNPVHTFPVAGVYTVIITVSDGVNTVTTSVTITVSNLMFRALLNMTLYPKASGNDTITVNGYMHLNKGWVIANSTLVLTVSGNSQTFTLDANGHAENPNASFQLHFKKGNPILSQEARFRVVFKNGGYAANVYANSTLTPSGFPDHATTTLLFQNQFLTANVPLKFKTIANDGIKTVKQNTNAK